MEFFVLQQNVRAAWDTTEEYCLNSGIGGLRYCADRSRHWFERLSLLFYESISNFIACFTSQIIFVWF